MYPLFAKSTIYKKSYGEKMLINLTMQAKAMISEAFAKNRNKISMSTMSVLLRLGWGWRPRLEDDQEPT